MLPDSAEVRLGGMSSQLTRRAPQSHEDLRTGKVL